MKLVDILARELKEWPQGARWILSDGANGCYADMGAKCIALGIDCSDFDGNIGNAVFEKGWQAAVDALKDEKVAEWNGEGLPPVGTVCEFAGGTHCPDDPFDKDLKEGDEVTIIAHFKDGESELAAFTFNPRNLSRGNACVEQGMHGCFRPIRTPEQIAADLYEEDAAEIAKILSGLKNADEIFIAKTLLDCGYRKFEIVDN